MTSFPPAFLDELKTRLSIAEVVGRKVVWDQRKTNRGKGDFWACCPFHQEKTPSFHVDDRKGFYKCFSCEESGDAIGFVMKTENLSFPEAIEVLAGEVGLPMPARDPRTQETADRRGEVQEALEAAIRHYRMTLGGAAGAAARAYLDGRGLDAATIDRFEIGYCPPQGAVAALRDKGIAEDRLKAADIARDSSRGSGLYDPMYDRIVFPIRDGRGRPVGFGGRAMRDDAKAKYLNSAQTELFDKSRSLYNHAGARAAAAKGATLIAAEGYMDVIALARAGFDGAVAPLGTAVTEAQLQMLWRMSDCPVFALDGDAPGLRAAARVIDRTLPLLGPSRTVRFALMPPGLDPDDLLAQAGGVAKMQAILDEALPLIDLLWRFATEGQEFSTPEARTALQSGLLDKVKTIPDDLLRSNYGREIRDRCWTLFRQAAPVRRGPARSAWRGRGVAPVHQPMAETRAAAAGLSGAALQEAALLVTLARMPALLPDRLGLLERLQFSAPQTESLAEILLATAAPTAEGVRAECRDAGRLDTLESLEGLAQVAALPWLRGGGDAAAAADCIDEIVMRLRIRQGIAGEVAEAQATFAGAEEGGASDHVAWRLREAVLERERGRQIVGDVESDSLGEDRDALRARLSAVVENAAQRDK